MVRIFNNFDTKFKKNKYDSLVQKHGKNNVVLIERWKFYWIFKGILPLIFFLLLSFIVMSSSFNYFYDNYEVIFYMISFVFLAASLYMIYYLIHTLISYKMDFTIVTSYGVMTHSQNWILSHSAKDLPAWKIRSIQSARKWLWNIFGYWYIEVITDWSVSEENKDWWWHMAWKTKLTFVDKPNQVKDKIINICLNK